MFPFNKIKKLPSYIARVEALKGISKNLYKKDVEGNLYDYMLLSMGEQGILKFFADVYLVANLKKLNKNFDSAEVNVFLFDEMNLSWHPEWQRKMVYYIHDLFTQLSPKGIINIIFTTHSPIILSDMPKENVVFLNKTDNDKDIQTFGANINDLFNHGLFLNCFDCMPMGEFVKQEINRIFTLLRDGNIKINQKEIETKINLIGEPMLRNSLLEFLYTRIDYSYNDKINKFYKKKIIN